MSMTISVSPSLRDWIERRVAAGDYGSAADYLEDLVERDRREVETRDAVVLALEQGEASGRSSRQVPHIIAAITASRGT